MLPVSEERGHHSLSQAAMREYLPLSVRDRCQVRFLQGKAAPGVRFVVQNFGFENNSVYGGELLIIELAIEICGKKFILNNRNVDVVEAEARYSSRYITQDKTVLCPTHAPKPGVGIAAAGPGVHQSGDTLRSLAVFRKVYVQRPETKQIASIMQQGELTQGSTAVHFADFEIVPPILIPRSNVLHRGQSKSNL